MRFPPVVCEVPSHEKARVRQPENYTAARQDRPTEAAAAL
jgi:hypothetical protein